MDRKQFGQQLRRAREAAGLTQRQLAERLGLKSGQSIHDVESGKNAPSVERAEELLAACGFRLVSLPGSGAPLADVDQRIAAAVESCSEQDRILLANIAERLGRERI